LRRGTTDEWLFFLLTRLIGRHSTRLLACWIRWIPFSTLHVLTDHMLGLTLEVTRHAVHWPELGSQEDRANRAWFARRRPLWLRPPPEHVYAGTGAAPVRGRGFPNARGAIDGTLIPLAREPSRDCEGGGYVDRKERPSMSVLAVADYRARFIFAQVGPPGSYHDGRSLKESRLWSHWHRLFPPGHNSGYLLADSAFMILPWIVPSQRSNADDWCVREWNHQHASARVVVERAFGLLKARWPLLHQMPFDDPRRATRFIQLGIRLHNLLQEDATNPELDREAVECERADSALWSRRQPSEQDLPNNARPEAVPRRSSLSQQGKDLRRRLIRHVLGLPPEPLP
jgi:hypothetical protein